MPSSPSRLHPTRTQRPEPRTIRSLDSSQFTAYPPEASLHGVPTLHQSSFAGSFPSNNSSSKQSRHGRSISHPFPSLFGITKKGDKRLDSNTRHAALNTMNDDGELDFTIDEVRPLGQKGASQEEGELTTGTCATCGSTVRWPRHVNVYRCTACLMINDLEAPDESITSRPATSSSKQTGSPSTPIRRKSPPLSVERTRNITNECILILLRNRAQHLKSHARVQNSTESANAVRSALPDEYKEARRKESSGYAASNGSDTQRASSVNTRRPIPILPKSGSQRSIDTFTRSARSFPGPGLSTPTRAPPSPPEARERGRPTPSLEPSADLNSAPAKYVFKQLESYIIACLNDCDCLNDSFIGPRPSHPPRAASETSISADRSRKIEVNDSPVEDPMFEIDAKTLLLGDIGENGTWWAGDRRPSQRKPPQDANFINVHLDRRTPKFDWNAIYQWYDSVLSCGKDWRSQLKHLPEEDQQTLQTSMEEEQIESMLAEGRFHVQRTLLKAMENLLRRPGRPLTAPKHARFLLILVANPLLCSHLESLRGSDEVEHELKKNAEDSVARPTSGRKRSDSRNAPSSSGNGSATGHHSGVIKRMLGLMANLPAESHHHLVAWLCRVSEIQFREMVELVGGFVSYRLSRQHGRNRSRSNNDPTAGLIPTMSGPGAGTSAHLHAALGSSSQAATNEGKEGSISYSDDWQVKVAAKVMSLLFSANTHGKYPRFELNKMSSEMASRGLPLAARERAHRHAQLLPTSTFYNTLLDYADLIADFEIWESRRGKFSFCQYPMFFSIWAKIHIMEHDARRQMEVKARDAFFNSILSRKAVSQYLVLKVRRDCLVDDSLRMVSEVVGTGQEEIKKGLKIEFVGEEGVDAGGLRKEWFLLLVREVFDPDHGLFIYDEDSHYCYFNPNSFETSDQFFLVGVVLGLAIYNSTILDVALPPFAFRKLLASAPPYNGPATTAIRPTPSYTLDDLAEWKPSLARGLRQLLEHEGDVEATFCRDFVADVERYGQVTQVPLCAGGERRPVTNANRREFVELYVRHALDTAVARQFEPFKRGFFTVCGGNALALFRPEEIELLVRGSDEPLDVASLRAVATYENWDPQRDAVDGGTAGGGDARRESRIASWFWEAFEDADARAQRKILTFITGSDRIPAMGTTSLSIKIACLGDDARRYPVARTCFNVLGLYRYGSKRELEAKLWRAVLDSEGFGLK